MLLSDQKASRLGKNKKKSWRKIPVADVEDFVVSQSKDANRNLPNEASASHEIFFQDSSAGSYSTGSSKHEYWKNKQLKSHTIHMPDLTIVPVTKPRESKPRKQTRKRQSTVETNKANKATPKSTDAQSVYNLWDSEFANQTKFRKRTDKTPSALPAVEIPLPGASYNPTFRDWQNLLAVANDTEVGKEKRRLCEKRKTDSLLVNKSDAPTEESMLNELTAGLFEQPDETVVEESNDNVDSTVPLTARVRREAKKTRQQRTRAKERIIKERRLKAEKTVKKREQDVYRLKSIKSEIVKEEKKSKARQKVLEQTKKMRKFTAARLGHGKYEAPNLEVKLSDELVGSLRLLKPEGSVLEDRLKSLQRRNIIEPPSGRKPSKRRFKPIQYERRGHKEVTI